MTDHAILSSDLARALGWRVSHITASGEVHVCLKRGSSRKFGYRDPTVCLPLIEWLMREHAMRPFWHLGANVYIVKRWESQATTLPEAVARAVIAVKAKP